MVTFAELAVEAGRMAMLLRDEAAQVELRRMALSRSALVWWQGEAAAGYQRRVLEQGAALAADLPKADDSSSSLGGAREGSRRRRTG